MLNFKILDNFISPSCCDILVNFFIENKSYQYLHRDTFVLPIYPNDVDRFEERNSNLLKFINSNITYLIKKISSRTFINYSEIVCWPEYSFQEPHTDFDYHTYTSILYLNDDFSGGETFIGSHEVKPKKGSIVFFQGNKHIHGVNKVLSGTRYTFPTWFKSME